MPLDIAWEDASVVVVNKPSGLVVHPAPGHLHGTLVHGLLHHCTDLAGIGGTLRPGIVHRIDRDTSGLLVCTKNDEAHHCLTAQFAAHTIERTYLALVVLRSGPPLEDRLTLRTGHTRHPTDRLRYTGRHGGREAVTHIEVVERFHRAALVRCTLETGRTHQIRMHLSERGWPLLGDRLYGGPSVVPRWMPRQALHALTLGFDLPDGRHIHCEAAPPEDFAQALLRLRSGQPGI